MCCLGHSVVIWVDEDNIILDLPPSLFSLYSPPIQSEMHRILLCSLLFCTLSNILPFHY